jgi:hypothetical protein
MVAWAVAGLLAAPGAGAAEPMRALIVDGQNNHGNWPTTTKMMKSALEETGLFNVDVVTHAPQGPDPSFRPDFARYAVVVSNFGHGAADWPEETRKAFEAYVAGGGGFVAVHAADNSFPSWPLGESRRTQRPLRLPRRRGPNGARRFPRPRRKPWRSVGLPGDRA